MIALKWIGDIAKHGVTALVLALAVTVGACSSNPDAPKAPQDIGETPDYRIGPGDQLSIFVWRNPDLSMGVPVRPDGRFSMPLVEDMVAANKTPTQLGRDLEAELEQYIQDPIVTVMVTGFQGAFDQQVRIVGEAAQPQALPYRDDMTLLDAMIAVGGLTEFAAGNRAVLERRIGDGERQTFRARLDDLLKDGDVSANVALLPGDVIIIPQSFF